MRMFKAVVIGVRRGCRGREGLLACPELSQMLPKTPCLHLSYADYDFLVAEGTALLFQTMRASGQTQVGHYHFQKLKSQ